MSSTEPYSGGNMIVYRDRSSPRRRCHAGDPQRAQSAQQIRECWGAPQILVNSAAVQFMRPFDDLSQRDGRKTRAVTQGDVSCVKNGDPKREGGRLGA